MNRDKFNGEVRNLRLHLVVDNIQRHNGGKLLYLLHKATSGDNPLHNLKITPSAHLIHLNLRLLLTISIQCLDKIKQSNYNNYYAAPQQNAYYSSPTTTYEGYGTANLNGYTPVGYDQAPQQKRGPKVGLIVGIVLLLILLVGGAFAGYLYVKKHNQNSNATNATPSVVSTPTVTPLFSDPFVNNNTGWDLSSLPGKFSVKVGGGSMVLEDDDNKLLPEILPGKSLTDFRLDVNATLTKGDPSNGYGVMIREASIQGGDLGTYYRFELYGDGSYAIFKGSLDATGQSKSNTVQTYTVNGAIAKAGNVNHITIIAKGPTMTLVVNGQTVYTYTDDNYKSGSIALFISNLPGLTSGAQATFTKSGSFPRT